MNEKAARHLERRRREKRRRERRRAKRDRRTAARGDAPPKPRRIARWIGRAALGFLVATILLVGPWRWIAPPTSAFMLRARLVADTPVDQRWVPFERISRHLVLSVVASEDQKFPEHSGFDVDQIARAVNERRDRPRGASTITQQVAKNLFLWPGRSFLRKGVEAWLTVWIELLWSKRRILEVYLNVAEFAPGVYGAEAAGERLFGVPASRLGPWQAALLAAVLPNPKKLSAARPSPYVRERAEEIRRAARALGPHYVAGL